MPSYLTDMSRDGTWGDHIVLMALAHALTRTVVVVSSLGESHDVTVEPASHHGGPILLGHLSENHYVSLEPMDFSGIRKELHVPKNASIQDSNVTVTFTFPRCRSFPYQKRRIFCGC